MGKYVNGLLGDASSVDKIAAAMQAAPRAHPRDAIDRPTRSEVQEQQPAAGQEQQMSPEEQEAMMLQERQAGMPEGQAATPHNGPMLSPNAEAMPEDTSTGGAMMPPSPEEEEQARVFMSNVVDFLYGEGLPSITKVLKESDDVPKTVGETVAQLVTVQMDASEAAGKNISPNILMALGAEAVSQVYELAAALGVWDQPDDTTAQKDMNLSLNYAANLFVDIQTQTGRKDRLDGIMEAGAAVASGKYDSQPGNPMPDNMAPVDAGGLL